VIYFPKGWDLLNEAQKMVICNGCGGKMLKVPDKILGLDIKLVCNIHDFMYAMGETEEDKALSHKTRYGGILEPDKRVSPDSRGTSKIHAVLILSNLCIMLCSLSDNSDQP